MSLLPKRFRIFGIQFRQLFLFKNQQRKYIFLRFDQSNDLNGYFT